MDRAKLCLVALLFICPLISTSAPLPFTSGDPRDIRNGRTVSDLNGYYDSQNIVAVRGNDGATTLSVVLHHSHNHEGGIGLRLYHTTSTNFGKTWSALNPIEPSLEKCSHDGYQLLHRHRIYVFYGYNEHLTFTWPNGTELPRPDMQLKDGYYFKYTDDVGVTWSDRYLIPVRRTLVDMTNPWQGEVMGMFMCDKPVVVGQGVYFSFMKTPDAAGETEGSEVFFLHSPDFLAVQEPGEAAWATLPEGDTGLVAPPGGEGNSPIGEEPHIMPVGASTTRLFSLWRSMDGYLAGSYSSDAGRTWDTPFWMTYEGTAGGATKIKNPRGAITPFVLKDGTYLLIFYNNAHTERLGYTSRRLCWLTHGRATDDGAIAWAQPEVVLWHYESFLDERPNWNPDWAIVDGAGYVDWVELGENDVWYVASNKYVVRLHQVEPRMLAMLRRQSTAVTPPSMLPSLVFHYRRPTTEQLLSPSDKNLVHRGPILGDLRSGQGFSFSLLVQGAHKGEHTLVSAMSTVTAVIDDEPSDETITKGYSLSTTVQGNVRLYLTDGFENSFEWATDAGCAGRLWDGERHLVTFIVDGGPLVVSVVVDDKLCDGGEGVLGDAAQGWRYVPAMGELGGAEITVTPGGQLHAFMVFDAPLLTTQAIGMWRAETGRSNLGGGPTLSAKHGEL